jgi:hypothetical protein
MVAVDGQLGHLMRCQIDEEFQECLLRSLPSTTFGFYYRNVTCESAHGDAQ